MYRCSEACALTASLLMLSACNESGGLPTALTPPEPSADVVVAASYEMFTTADAGYGAWSVTGLAMTFVSEWTINAQIRESEGYLTIRESWPALKGGYNHLPSPLSERVIASFSQIPSCGTNYTGLHVWDWNVDAVGVTKHGAKHSDETVAVIPRCSCDDGSRLYDPYHPSNECGTDHDGGGSNYSPYDEPYEGADTGGQMVDFNTGMPNGNPSACGDQARVTYICLEFTYEDGTTSQTCGWATVC
jgi:hypothetical protein